MKENKNTLLEEQVNKIQDVIDVLHKDFSIDIEKEINFLNVVKDNLNKSFL